MRFYLTTVHEKDAAVAAELGCIEGVLVPRVEVARTGRDYPALLSAISAMSFSAVYAQSDVFDVEGMLAEATELAQSVPSLVYCMPMTLASTKAASRCAKEQVRTALQWVASPVQALLAARAGATAILLDARELGEASIPLVPLVSDIRHVFDVASLTTQILVEGVRDVAEVACIASARADGVFCTWDVMTRLAHHPVTDRGMERILEKWSPVT